MAQEQKEEKEEKIKVCVLGAGSYGTAMAMVAARRGHDVSLYLRDKNACEVMIKDRYNPKRFRKNMQQNIDGLLSVPDYLKLPKNITPTTSVEDAIKDSKLIIHCIPTQFTKSFLEKYSNIIPKDVYYVCTAKGIEETTHHLLCDILPKALNRAITKENATKEEILESKKQDRIVYLSGPSFAIEIMKNDPIAVTIAAYSSESNKQVQKWLTSQRFRIYETTDVIGVELGGALKNPLAIGCGICRGLGYGASTVAAIVTRGNVEMQRLCIAMGGRPETLAGLAGMGDLMLTCFSSQSRNNRFGYYLGSKSLQAGDEFDIAKHIQDAFKEIGEIVEGYKTCKVVYKLREEYGVRMPIFDVLGGVLLQKVDVKDALKLVTSRDPGTEAVDDGAKDDSKQNN